MTTRLPRPFTAVVAAVAATALTVTALVVGMAASAEAKPPVKPGPVTGLAMTLTKPADNFTVDASWDAATNATTYVVALTNATTGAALAGNSVGATRAKAATKGKAWKRAKAAVVEPGAKGAWVVRLTGLRKGKLIVRVNATDLAGNVSETVAKKAVLTAS